MALQLISISTFLLTFFYVGMMLFLRKGWLKIRQFIPLKDFHPRTRVSIIISARNEETNIAKTITDILAQNYPKDLTEFIVVDDQSTDNTAAIISSFSAEGVRLLQLNPDQKINSYKKKAIAEAIKISGGELIITTDADCRMDKAWISTIVGCYEKNHYKLISSPVIFFNEKNWFEEMQTLEFLFLIGLGASTIGNKIPSTCNGANLAYQRSVFFEVDGFKGIDELASGDDELLLHKIAAKYPNSIGFCKSQDAVVNTYAKENLGAFISQRKRWASKSTHYKNKSIVALGVLLWLFNLIILIDGIMAIYNPEYLRLFITALGMKFVVELLFMIPLCKFARRQNLLFYLPLLTVVHVIYFIFIGIAGNSGKYEWKGRTVR